MSERHRIVYSCPICHYMVTIVTAQSEPPLLCCIKHKEKCEECGGSGNSSYCGKCTGRNCSFDCPMEYVMPDYVPCHICSGTGKRWTEMEIYSHIDLIKEERVV